MDYILFARWFGLVSVILSLGILFNLEDAQEMAKSMIKTETGYIMGGVLPIIFGSLALLFVTKIDAKWEAVVTIIGSGMLLAGIFRVMLVDQWKAMMKRHLEQIPFLFSLFGLMLGCVLLYIGFLSKVFVY
ncbi:MAG TPA: hypothetical protein VL360_00695 [Gammaproteobacteria bacterium]|jgi:hypothetical protein|nr:hypothetical protein [Gammaproteobacteria bacterium]